MSVYLVCEGSPNGLDNRVLNLVIVNRLSREVQIESAGGDRSLGSVAQYLTERYGVRAFAVEDRNFRSLEEAEQTWARPNQTHWIWRRHEIENYLLDPRLVANAFRALRETSVRGADRLPDDEQAVFSLLQRLARPMLENHTGWLTYWHLVSCKNVEANDARLLRPKDSFPDLPPPNNRDEWLRYLCSECLRLKQACRHLTDDTTFDELVVIERYDSLLSHVTHPDFFNSGRFLLDLGGHELMSALCAYINQAGVPRLSQFDLQTELLNALDRLYKPGFFKPDDFAQLADKLT
jgi:hypothetical protein